MIHKLWLFILIVIGEIILITGLWLFATTIPFWYSFFVIVITIASLGWWRYTTWKEKQKIYDKETLLKKRQKFLRLFFSFVGGLLIFTYLTFALRVLLG